MPGIAQLRLARGDLDGAISAIGRALQDASNQTVRARLLGAQVEITLSAGDIEGARAASRELAAISDILGAPWLDAVSSYSAGAVLLANQESEAALSSLRHTWSAWQDLEAPYESARCRELIGIAYQQIGDPVAAEMEFDAASRVFHDLGAIPDLTRVLGTFSPSGLRVSRGSQHQGDRGLASFGYRKIQPRDCRIALSQRKDCGAPSEQYLFENRRFLPSCGYGLGF